MACSAFAIMADENSASSSSGVNRCYSANQPCSFGGMTPSYSLPLTMSIDDYFVDHPLLMMSSQPPPIDTPIIDRRFPIRPDEIAPPQQQNVTDMFAIAPFGGSDRRSFGAPMTVADDYFGMRSASAASYAMPRWMATEEAQPLDSAGFPKSNGTNECSIATGYYESQSVNIAAGQPPLADASGYLPLPAHQQPEQTLVPTIVVTTLNDNDEPQGQGERIVVRPLPAIEKRKGLNNEDTNGDDSSSVRFVSGGSVLARCEVCDRKVDCRHYANHVKFCQHKKMLSCDDCSESFNQQLNLRLHCALEHSDVNAGSSLRCPLCSRVFARLASFRCHVALHHVDDTLHCELCQQEFHYYTQLKRHKRVEHLLTEGDVDEVTYNEGEVVTTEESLKPCDQCDILFTNDSEVKDHRRIHRIIKQSLKTGPKKTVTCKTKAQQEETVATTTATDVTDGATVSSGRKDPLLKHSCTICGKSFDRSSTLKRHHLIHTGARPFECKICGKTFNQKGALMFHSNIHLAQKPHVCTLCGQDFAQRGNLRKHVMSVHRFAAADWATENDAAANDGSQRETWSCNFCCCVFRCVQALQVHMTKRHPDENPMVIPTAAEEDDVHLRIVPSNSKSVGNNDAKQTDGVLLIGGDVRSRNKAGDSTTADVGAIGSGGQQLNAISQKLLKKATDQLLSIRAATSSTAVASMISGTRPRENIRPRKAPKKNGDTFYNSNAEQMKHVRVWLDDKRRRVWQCTVCLKECRRSSDLVRHLRLHTGEKPYSCTMCDQKFSLKSTLNNHLRKRCHLAIPASRCHVCTKQLSTSSSLSRHMKLHCRRNFACSICSRSFSSLKKLNRHRSSGIHRPVGNDGLLTSEVEPIIDNNGTSRRTRSYADAVRPFKCGSCDASFKRKQHLDSHRVSRHSGGLRAFTCRQCGRQFVNVRNLTEHLRRHAGLKLHRCLQCAKSFVTSGGLGRHSVIHSNLRPFKCPFCDKAFKRGVQSRKHARSCKNKLQLSALPADYIEPDDTQSILTLDEAVRSQSHFQSDVTPSELVQNSRAGVSAAGIALSPAVDSTVVRCSVCDFSSSIIGDIVAHLSQTTRDKCHFSADYNCLVCSQPYVGLRRIRRHYADKHGYAMSVTAGRTAVRAKKTVEKLRIAGDDLFANGTLSQLFLDNSVDVVVIGGGAGPCPYCEKEFTKPSDLQRHVRIHTGEKPFKCPNCGRDFRLKSTMMTHLRTHIDDDMPVFPCKVCGRTMMSKGALKVHVRLHTNERPLECAICGERFRNSANRAAHVRRIHVSARADLSKNQQQPDHSADFDPSQMLDSIFNRPSQPPSSSLVLGAREKNSAFTPVPKPMTGGFSAPPFATAAPSPPVNNVVPALPNAQASSSLPEKVALRVYRDADGENNLRVEVIPLNSGSFAPPSTPGEYLIETSLLSYLAARGLVLKIPLTETEFPGGTELSVDPDQLLRTLESQSSVVDMASSTDAALFNLDEQHLQPSSSSVTTGQQQQFFTDGQCVDLDGTVDNRLSEVNNSASQSIDGTQFIVECLICDVGFDTADESLRHFQSEDHETAMLSSGRSFHDKAFSCECCTKSFDSQGKLVRHRVVHTRERPFSCSLCDQRYSQRDSLRKHVKSAHEKLRPFACPHCDRTFVHKWNRTRHTKIHKAVADNDHRAHTVAGAMPASILTRL